MKPLFSQSLRVLATLAVVVAAAVFGWLAWRLYMGSPWTRDAAVRAYVVKIASQVPGEILQLPVADNQFVHKGDLLMLIDPTNYAIAVRLAEAAVERARAEADNAHAEMARRQKLDADAVTVEELQTYEAQAASAEANYQSALGNLQQARVNLKRTQIRSPVNGYVTNLSAQLGDYATVGQRLISLVNADSFWIDAYFEETVLQKIQVGDGARIKLMGYASLLRGEVTGVARGIDVPNTVADASGLASVNPIFTFVRLAQRVPVRIRLQDVPKGIELVAGLTATVQIEPRQPGGLGGPAPSAPLSARPESSAQSNAAKPDSSATADLKSMTQTSPASPARTPQTLPPPRSDAAAPGTPPPPPATTGEASANSAAGPAASAEAADPPAAAAIAEAMPPSEYLGKTIDLFQPGQTAAPERRRVPDSLRRRAYRHWSRHYD